MAKNFAIVYAIIAFILIAFNGTLIDVPIWIELLIIAVGFIAYGAINDSNRKKQLEAMRRSAIEQYLHARKRGDTKECQRLTQLWTEVCPDASSMCKANPHCETCAMSKHGWKQAIPDLPEEKHVRIVDPEAERDAARMIDIITLIKACVKNGNIDKDKIEVVQRATAEGAELIETLMDEYNAGAFEYDKIRSIDQFRSLIQHTQKVLECPWNQKGAV